MFETPWTMALSLAITTGLLLYLTSGRSPATLLMDSARYLAKDRLPRLVLGGMVAVLLLNALELRLESLYPGLLSRDLTAVLKLLDAGAVRLIQRLAFAPLTYFLTYVYILVFPALPLVSFVFYSATGDRAMLPAVFFTVLLNYVVALALYFLVPAKEAWYGNPDVRFLIPSVYPAFEAQYRPLSGFNHAFPSVHTSLSVSLAALAARAGYRRLAAVLGGAAGLIALSTVYLGVHWVPDVLGGIGMAAMASASGPALADASRRVVAVWTPRLLGSPGTEVTGRVGG